MQNHHALFFPRRLIRGRGQSRIEHVDVVAVAGEVDEIGAFLRDAADGQRLAQIEITLQVALHRLNFVNAAVIRGDVRPGADDNRPSQARST